MLTKRQQSVKRVFDLSIAIGVLPFVIIPLILLTLIATVHTRASGLFVQERVGQFGKLFKLYKIRTLSGTNHKDVLEIQKATTPLGRWLRTTKLDELPQLFNVLMGDMSWVGPRPDVPGYADMLEGEDRIILALKPGVTGPATLKYKDEDAVLLKQENPLVYNDTVIWPDKVAINKAYLIEWSLQKDIQYLLRSVFG